MNGNDSAQLLYLMLILASLGGWVMVEYRARLGQATRTALAWGAIVVALMGAYGLWQGMSFAPHPAARVSDGGALEIPQARDGHYYVDARVNGVAVTFLIDTGATDIVLSAEDARRAGLDPEGLSYLDQVDTANGPASVASVRLESLEVGPFAEKDVRAYVIDAPTVGSVLGMSYLQGFGTVTISDQVMRLRR